ncbi:MAG: hypothetical protein ISS74_07695 [Planctomycetes bacterium]|nr:hypothetical protein [Planctomycetota bacterium]
MLRDRGGRIIFRGRTADIGPCSVKVVGPPPAAVSEGMDVWLEMRIPTAGASGPKQRRLKVQAYIRRVTDIGKWKCVIVVIAENDFAPDLLIGPRRT